MAFIYCSHQPRFWTSSFHKRTLAGIEHQATIASEVVWTWWTHKLPQGNCLTSSSLFSCWLTFRSWGIYIYGRNNWSYRILLMLNKYKFMSNVIIWETYDFNNWSYRILLMLNRYKFMSYVIIWETYDLKFYRYCICAWSIVYTYICIVSLYILFGNNIGLLHANSFRVLCLGIVWI